MDNVAHALAGCLLAAGTVSLLERRGIALSKSFRRAAVTIGIVTAELPDSDLVYAGSSLGMGKLGYLLHHRGHTHTVVFAIASALLVWLVTLALRRQLRQKPFKSALLLLALAGTLSHLALDFSNNYGIHPFWPLENSWYYGDAVFIIEPWLWVVAIPALWMAYHATMPRVVFSLLLVAILGAAWSIGMVEREVAIALTAGTVVSFGAFRAIPARQRISVSVATWLIIEAMFFGASGRARNLVHDAVGNTTFREVARTPFIGNPLCYNALVIEQDGEWYRVSEAVVATVSSLRAASDCAAESRSGVPGNTRSTRVATASVRWGGTWSAPLADLRRIVQQNCEVSAAMQFIRAPVWRESPGGAVEIGDIRFGSLTNGFASITTAKNPVGCPRFVPGWIPPRHDLLSTPP